MPLHRLMWFAFAYLIDKKYVPARCQTQQTPTQMLTVRVLSVASNKRVRRCIGNEAVRCWTNIVDVWRTANLLDKRKEPDSHSFHWDEFSTLLVLHQFPY